MRSSRVAQLTRLDVRLVALSVIVGAGMASVLIVDNYAYIALEQRLDQQLRNVSVSMRTDFAAELNAAATALDEFATQWVASPSRDIERSRGGIFALPGLPGPRTDVIFQLRRTYPFFDMVGWADAGGEQREKWATRDVGPLINIKAFPVTRDAEDGHTWDIFATAGPYGPELPRRRQPAVHLMLSPNTGELVPLMLVRVNGGDMAFIVPDMMSVVDPLLPTGFGFAIIQNDGKVVYHSARLRSLYEESLPGDWRQPGAAISDGGQERSDRPGIVPWAHLSLLRPPDRAFAVDVDRIPRQGTGAGARFGCADDLGRAVHGLYRRPRDRICAAPAHCAAW